MQHWILGDKYFHLHMLKVCGHWFNDKTKFLITSLFFMFVFPYLPPNLSPDWMGNKKVLDMTQGFFEMLNFFQVWNLCRCSNNDCSPPTLNTSWWNTCKICTGGSGKHMVWKQSWESLTIHSLSQPFFSPMGLCPQKSPQVIFFLIRYFLGSHNKCLIALKISFLMRAQEQKLFRESD